MGSFASVFQNESQPTMKVLLFVALATIAAVMAEPEAEPKADADAAADAWHGYYGYGHRWGGYYGYPCRGYYGYYRGKRPPDAEAEPTAAAEAEPEADAAADAWYGYYGYPGYYGHRAYGYGYGLGYYGTVGVDITDTPTPGLTVITTLERDLLMPNPRLRPNPRLKPNPGITAVGVDTMAILTLTGDITDTDMAVVTGGKL